jgi:hypothetical protein
MADTIVTTPGTNDSGMAGWFVALIVVIAVAGVGFVMYQNGAFMGAPAGDSTNINITAPTPTTAPTAP